jgi:hypothetical protein
MNRKRYFWPLFESARLGRRLSLANTHFPSRIQRSKMSTTPLTFAFILFFSITSGRLFSRISRLLSRKGSVDYGSNRPCRRTRRTCGNNPCHKCRERTATHKLCDFVLRGRSPIGRILFGSTYRAGQDWNSTANRFARWRVWRLVCRFSGGTYGAFEPSYRFV